MVRMLASLKAVVVAKMALVVPDKSQLKVAMSPWRPVWYCRHPVGPAMVSPQVYCLAWMDQVLELVVSRVFT